MVRMAGILCGSALAISFLIVALGLPEFLPEPLKGPPTVPQPVADSSEAPNSAQDVIETEIPAEPVEPEPAPAKPIKAIAFAPEPQLEDESWYAFWSPFRSEIAANGFVSQLQRTTGMDYRVVRVKPGVYEVAFAYSGTDDIAIKLAAISAATGLEMPGG